MRNCLQKNENPGKVHVYDGTAKKATAALQNTPEENKVSDFVIPNHFALNKNCQGGNWCIFTLKGLIVNQNGFISLQLSFQLDQFSDGHHC